MALPVNGFGGVAVAVSGFDPSLLTLSTSSSISNTVREIATGPRRSETLATMNAREKGGFVGRFTLATAKSIFRPSA
ncbi:MAG: hypothetical protein ACTHN7_02225 [Solirubrobacterales bacterium]